MIKWIDIKEIDKTSLKQLYYIEILEKNNCSDDFYEKQKKGIKVMLPSFLVSFTIPLDVKKEVEKKAFSIIQLSKTKNTRNKASLKTGK